MATSARGLTPGMDTFLNLRDVESLLESEPTFFYCEIMFYALGFLTFCHAMWDCHRSRCLWFAIVLHGIVVECVSYSLPDIDSFWHSQSSIMLFWGRLPLHIVFLYPVFYYVAIMTVARSNLSERVQPFAVGLGALLIDIPFDIMGIKLLWWTWHDSDPNVLDRFYDVPLTSFFFHMSFSFSICLIFNFISKYSGVFAILMTGFLSFPLGVLQFIPIYHVLHDVYFVPTSICLMILLSLYTTAIFCADKTDTKGHVGTKKGIFSDVLQIIVIIHFCFFIFLVFTSEPQDIRASGIRQTVGDCKVFAEVNTPIGKVLYKKLFLCAEKFEQLDSGLYFDFTCLDVPIAQGSTEYLICGTMYSNRLEYQVLVTCFSLVGLIWFLRVLRTPNKTVDEAVNKKQPIEEKEEKEEANGNAEAKKKEQ